MEKLQDDDYKMINTTNDCIIRNILAWKPNDIMQELSDDTTAAKAYIYSQMMIQMKGSSSETLIKNEARQAMEKILFKVKSGEIAYSNSVKDRTNFISINRSNSEIQAMNDEIVTAYAEMVLDLALSLAEKLVPYNIKAEDTLLLKSNISTYKGVLGGKRDVLTTVVIATENIAKEISRIKGRFRNELDPLVETFIDTAPDFVGQYHSARKIVHYGVRHLNPEAEIDFTAVDSITKAPLRLVKIEVVETDDKALTDDLGKATLKIAKAGVYTITYTKPGYEVLTKTNIELGVGDVLKLEADLKPKIV